MHILDAICSVSRSSKCIKIVGGWGFVPDWEAYSTPSDPLARFKGAYFKAPTSKGRGGKEKKR